MKLDELPELIELSQEYDAALAQLSQVKDRIAAAAAALIPSHAKYQVGDCVKCRRNEYQITNIHVHHFVHYNGEHSISFRYYGRKVLKSGELHKNQTELYELSW